VAADALPSRVASPVFEVVGGSTSRGVRWARARRDLDMLSAPVARAELMGVLSEAGASGCVLVYLGAECFVDLHGLRVLVDLTAHQRFRGGELVVVSPPRCLRVMLALLDLDGRLALEATARDAARSARTPGAGRDAGADPGRGSVRARPGDRFPVLRGADDDGGGAAALPGPRGDDPGAAAVARAAGADLRHGRRTGAAARPGSATQ
jgi:anti-anti-sigma regulatory factor